MTNSQILTVSFLSNIGDDKRNGLSFLNPAETTLNRRQALFLGTIKDQWMVGGGLVEFGFAQTSAYLRSSPQGNQPYVVTPFGASGNYFADQTTRTGREEWLANGFVAPMHAHGSHQIQVGIDVEHSASSRRLTGTNTPRCAPTARSCATSQFLGSPQQFKNNVEAYGYALDRWNPVAEPHAGRWFPHAMGPVHRGRPVAPRLSAAWSPKWSGGTRFAAGWGIFYDALTLDMLALSQEQDQHQHVLRTHGPCDRWARLKPASFWSPHNLRLPRFALTSFSAERKLAWNIYGKMNLISREGSRGFTFDEQSRESLHSIFMFSITSSASGIGRPSSRARGLFFRATNGSPVTRGRKRAPMP